MYGKQYQGRLSTSTIIALSSKSKQRTFERAKDFSSKGNEKRLMATDNAAQHREREQEHRDSFPMSLYRSA